MEELIAAMKKIKENSVGDREDDHIRADNLLVEFIGDERVQKAFDDIRKWYA